MDSKYRQRQIQSRRRECSTALASYTTHLGFKPLSNAAPPDEPLVVVPDVTGQTVRAAAFALHQRGLRVGIEGSGRVTLTVPAAGDSLPAGKTVVLRAGPAAKVP